MVRRYRSGWWLEQKYWGEGLTQAEIAEECGVSPATIRDWMKRFGIPRRDVEGENHPLYGEQRDEAVREQISETLSGREFSEEWRERISEAQRGEKLPAEVRARIPDSLTGLTRSEETRAKMSESTAGEQNPNWKGGHSRRYGPGWSVARERVRERDEVCQHCGHDGSERPLHVHHIVPVRLFHEASNVSLADAHVERNLVLLCARCHGRPNTVCLSSISCPSSTPCSRTTSGEPASISMGLNHRAEKQRMRSVGVVRPIISAFRPVIRRTYPAGKTADDRGSNPRRSTSSTTEPRLTVDRHVHERP